jgi:hypothetical protein
LSDIQAIDRLIGSTDKKRNKEAGIDTKGNLKPAEDDKW